MSELTPSSEVPGFADAEAALLADALGFESATLTARSREPLGDGSVAAFAVADAEAGELTYFVDTSGHPVAAETGLVLGDPASPEARVWLHPADPHLPALAPAAFGGAALALLARAAVVAVDQPRIIAYRPGRRAVLRVPTADAPVWVKVVRPSRAPRLVEAHAALAAAGIPLPHIVAWSPEGLIVLQDAAGTGAADVEWDPEALLDRADELRTAFAGADLTHPARTSIGARVPWYLERLRDALPATSELAARIQDALARTESMVQSVTIHGDLHFGQLFLDGLGSDIRLSAVIDVDTAGRGDPADDTSAFIAHAIASATLTGPASSARVWRLAEGALHRWGDERTRALSAVHLMGHAVGAAEGGDPARASELVDVAAVVLGGAMRLGRV